MAGPSRPAWIALAFALAALLACWSPLAAPFGLLTGLGATVLAWRARREGGRTARVALGLALLAAAIAGWVLAGAAGAWRPVGQAPSVPSPQERETGRSLDAAAEQSRAARERAGRQAEPAPGPRSDN
jgi:membrane protease YdiL (CAAX protease family)